MTEGVSSSSDATAQRAAEQARLRKERREAKIKASGSSRLDKITGIGGRVVAPEAANKTTAAVSKPTAAGDPDEVDISEHFYTPGAARLEQQQRRAAGAAAAMPSPAAGDDGAFSPSNMTEEQRAQLRQMMLGGGGGAPGTPGAGEEDPLMKMMAQLMGGAGGGGPNASPFAGMMGAQQQQQQQQQRPSSGPDMYGTVWRVVHALLALGLGLYVVLRTPFDGTRVQRELDFKLADADADGGSPVGLDEAKRNFFWAFATAEAVLLTTKFALDKGRPPPPGMLWSVANQLPTPWRGYVVGVMRYGQFFTTVRTDVLLCAFVLGVCAWWKGQL
ncbi:hypothetical protein G3M48_005863 [Beauveria asiatica]|uniref:Sad1 interacting factor 1 n=1 Tax=Beauveria asiatica TaxID=1069075 RepID=A0AAW0RQQ3_9HYPO